PLVAMFVANCCPLPNPAQVFEGECLARYEGFVHQGLRDSVVHVLLEAAFTARVLAQAALRVLGVDLLQPLAACVVALACLLHLPAAEGFPLAIGGETRAAKINAQRPPIRLSFVWRFVALGDVQIVDTSAPDQIGSADSPRRVYQQRLLA